MCLKIKIYSPVRFVCLFSFVLFEVAYFITYDMAMCMTIVLQINWFKIFIVNIIVERLCG